MAGWQWQGREAEVGTRLNNDGNKWRQRTFHIEVVSRPTNKCNDIHANSGAKTNVTTIMTGNASALGEDFRLPTVSVRQRSD